jgi:hypothetical protein
MRLRYFTMEISTLISSMINTGPIAATLNNYNLKYCNTPRILVENYMEISPPPILILGSASNQILVKY